MLLMTSEVYNPMNLQKHSVEILGIGDALLITLVAEHFLNICNIKKKKKS